MREGHAVSNGLSEKGMGNSLIFYPNQGCETGGKSESKKGEQDDTRRDTTTDGGKIKIGVLVGKMESCYLF